MESVVRLAGRGLVARAIKAVRLSSVGLAVVCRRYLPEVLQP